MKHRKTAILTACLLLCMGMLCLPAHAEDIRMSTATLIGDANNSGSIEAADVIKTQRFLLTADTDISVNADMNGDGTIDVFDLALIKRTLLGTYQPEDYTKLVINEVCASNGSSLISADGSTPDWIELYNGSDTAIHLGGYGLSDGTKDLFKYTFPETAVIAPGAYLVVLCDGDGLVTAGDGELLAPFNISNKKAETIYLTHPNNGTLDTVALPLGLPKDTTYGRYRNQGCRKLTATPGAGNDAAAITLNAPIFSRNGGFYDTSFALSLSAADGTVYYTLDGSDPLSSETAQKYSTPITVYNNTNEPNRLSAVEDVTLFDFPALTHSVDKGIVVRAAVKDQDGNCSDVISQSYFIGKTAAYYQDMKVISLATEYDNLFDPDKGIYMVGTAYYDWWNNGGKEQKLEPADASNPTNYNQHGKEWEIPASMQVIENGSAVYAANIDIRINGNWSRGYKQKSLRLCARSEYGDSKLRYEMIPGLTDTDGNPIDVFDKLILHNGGNDLGILYMRDALLQSLCSDLAFGTNAYEPCIVFIDGEFWGMYTIRERIDEDAIASHYHVDKDNVTFIKNWETTGLESVGAEFDKLCRWGMTHDMSVQENYQKICDAIDMESFMDLIAVETYLNNNDFAPTYLNNYQLWRVNTPEEGNPYGDGKWRFLLNDTDMCANIYGSAETAPSYDLLNNMYADAEYMNFIGLFYSLLDNAEFRETFRLRYLHIIETTFDSGRVSAAAEAYRSRCGDAIWDTNRRFSMLWYNYSYEFDTFLRFFRERPDYARKYLDNLISQYDRIQSDAE